MPMPVDHRLARVYRIGAGLTGTFLVVFGSLGFSDDLNFFATEGREVLGMSSNGALALLSVAVGGVLIIGAMIGGNVAAWLNQVVGALFMISGLINLCLLRTDLNFLAFKMSNVIFSFVVGTLVLTFGMYGRVSGGLPPSNPNRRRRQGAPAEVGGTRTSPGPPRGGVRLTLDGVTDPQYGVTDPPSRHERPSRRNTGHKCCDRDVWD